MGQETAGEGGEGGEEVCLTEEIREGIRKSYFLQYEESTTYVYVFYSLIWLLSILDVGLFLRQSPAERNLVLFLKQNPAERNNTSLPVQPNLKASLAIHFRRLREKMFSVHYMGILITVAILYSSFISKLFSSIYFAVNDTKESEEGPEKICTYHEEGEASEW